MHIAIHLDPQKQSVVERFPLVGEFVVRGSTGYTYKGAHSHTGDKGGETCMSCIQISSNNKVRYTQ